MAICPICGTSDCALADEIQELEEEDRFEEAEELKQQARRTKRMLDSGLLPGGRKLHGSGLLGRGMPEGLPGIEELLGGGLPIGLKLLPMLMAVEAGAAEMIIGEIRIDKSNGGLDGHAIVLGEPMISGAVSIEPDGTLRSLNCGSREEDVTDSLNPETLALLQQGLDVNYQLNDLKKKIITQQQTIRRQEDDLARVQQLLKFELAEYAPPAWFGEPIKISKSGDEFIIALVRDDDSRAECKIEPEAGECLLGQSEIIDQRRTALDQQNEELKHLKTKIDALPEKMELLIEEAFAKLGQTQPEMGLEMVTRKIDLADADRRVKLIRRTPFAEEGDQMPPAFLKLLAKKSLPPESLAELAAPVRAVLEAAIFQAKELEKAEQAALEKSEQDAEEQEKQPAE